jgi:hypothetical protein
MRLLLGVNLRRSEESQQQLRLTRAKGRKERNKTYDNGLETLEVGDTLNDGGQGVELLLGVLGVVSLSLETDSESLGRVSDTLGPDGLVKLGVDPDPVKGGGKKREKEVKTPGEAKRGGREKGCQEEVGEGGRKGR